MDIDVLGAMSRLDDGGDTGTAQQRSRGTAPLISPHDRG